MKYLKIINNFILIFSLSIVISCSAFSQSTGKFEYMNPLPNSSYASVKTNIIIRQGGVIDNATLKNNISVSGSKSGTHLGKLSLSDDSRTLIFTPSNYFQTDEIVTVVLSGGIRTNNGTELGSLKFSFRTSKNISNYEEEIVQQSSAKITEANTSNKSVSSLPSDFPKIVINKMNNPAPGYLFLAPTPYLIIADNRGVPIFYRKISRGQLYDFNRQANGLLTYFIYPVTCIGIDSSFNFVRNYTTTNGFTVDVYDLRVLPDGSYFMLGKRLVNVDISKIVEGGSTSAKIIDCAVQEFDSSGNLIFQWDVLDHYEVTDADKYVDLTQQQIDMVHFNAIEIEKDGNILVSARNLDEITKINTQTGDIIWRLGGKKNEFTFIDDNIGFSRQHDIRRFSNGDISLFDNGNSHSPPVSSFVEYKLDEVNKTATLIDRYSHNNQIFSPSRGMIQELPSGNRFISWGESLTPAITEIRPDDSVAFELSYGSYEYKYRAYRYNWVVKQFSTNTDSVDFGEIAYGDSSEKSITIFNNTDSLLTINGFYLSDSDFSVKDSLPLSVNPKSSREIIVQFKPLKIGIFNDRLNIRIFGKNQMIARQVTLYASTINLINSIDPPTDLKVQLISAGYVKLTWEDNADDANNYIVQ